MAKSHIEVYGDVLEATIGDPLCGCEVGVWEGPFSHGLLQRFPKLTMWMVDPWIVYGVEAAKSRSGLRKKSQAQMSAAMNRAIDRTMPMSDRRVVLVGTSLCAAKLIRRNGLDFVFLDGDHGYEAVQADIEAWYSRVRPGGIFSGHDYGARPDRRGKWGVKRAVDEFCADHGYTVQIEDREVWWIVKQGT